MASKSTASLALFFALNLLFFSLVSACGGGCPSPKPKPPSPKPKPTPPSPKPKPTPPSCGGGCPSPTPKPTPPSCGGGCPPKPKPPSPPTPTPSPPGKCPRDALKLGVCAKVLGSLLNITIGKPPVQPCCSLIQDLVDLEAAVCLCTAIKANVLGLNLNVPLSLSLLLNVCSKKVPSGFQCK